MVGIKSLCVHLTLDHLDHRHFLYISWPLGSLVILATNFAETNSACITENVFRIALLIMLLGSSNEALTPL